MVSVWLKLVVPVAPHAGIPALQLRVQPVMVTLETGNVDTMLIDGAGSVPTLLTVAWIVTAPPSSGRFDWSVTVTVIGLESKSALTVCAAPMATVQGSFVQSSPQVTKTESVSGE